jgi:hypothetical protein
MMLLINGARVRQFSDLMTSGFPAPVKAADSAARGLFSYLRAPASAGARCGSSASAASACGLPPANPDPLRIAPRPQRQDLPDGNTEDAQSDENIILS